MAYVALIVCVYLAAVVDTALGDVLPSSSREVLGAGPSVAGLRSAAARTRDQVLAVLGAG